MVGACFPRFACHHPTQFMKWHRQLHWQIIVALILGVVFGVVAAKFGWRGFVEDWVAPWGEIFLRLLKLIAVPLVLTSLMLGVSSLSDVNKLSRMGGKTIGIYVLTTAVAVVIGLLMVNVVKPGESWTNKPAQSWPRSMRTTKG